jgi:hypothetical protein
MYAKTAILITSYYQDISLVILQDTALIILTKILDYAMKAFL